MTPTNALRNAVEQFEGVVWASFGDPKPDPEEDNELSPGWVKFELEKTELGWRTLEFLAWAFHDMVRGGYTLYFFPTSAPPFANEPGTCLAFAVEFYIDHEAESHKIQKAAEFLNKCFGDYWPECKP